MDTIHPILEQAVRESAQRETKKPISYEKLLPYAIKTIGFLVRRAQGGGLTTYKEVGKEIGAGNPQNANRAFEAISRVLALLAEHPKFSDVGEFPDITAIVTKTGKSIGGKGAARRQHLAGKSAGEKQEWLEDQRAKSKSFQRWDEVLSFLSIKPLSDLDTGTGALKAFERASELLGGGKGPEHQAIQDWICRVPAPIASRLRGGIISVHQEFRFWSLDCADVLLKTEQEWVGFEVKPSTAVQDEIRKGLYQILKYQALIDGQLLAEGKPQFSKCFLVTGGKFPKVLVEISQRFRITVIEHALDLIASESAVP